MVSFEIRVAVIGYVSVGKTTVINALFGAEFGEVSMKRTTAVVNAYRIIQSKKEEEEATTDESEDDSVEVAPNPSSPADCLKKSQIDNAANRTSNSEVKEVMYDIVLNDPPQRMRANTNLVIVDIPGINEAGTSSKYKDYVNEKWHSFDVAVVVMDGRQGVNTEEQLDLLKLVKSNSDSVKKIPVIIVCNKIDDPDDQEQKNLLAEARGAIEDHFKVKDRKKALKDLIKQKDGTGRCKADLFPAVVPISAMHAFLYRSGSQLTFDEFKKMGKIKICQCSSDVQLTYNSWMSDSKYSVFFCSDKDFIERIGKESYGRQWRSYSSQKKLEKAFEAVNNEEQRRDGLEASNFDTFVKVISYCVGGDKRQSSIIRQQVDVSLERMAKANEECDLSAEVFSAYEKLNALKSPTDNLRCAFWRAFKKVRIDTLSAFSTSLSPAVFERPMKQLDSYLSSVRVIGWEGQTKKVAEQAKDLVLNYVMEILNRENELSKAPDDLSLIFGSMLLLSHNATFCMNFGALKMELDRRYSRAKLYADENGISDGKCPECRGACTKLSSDKVEYCSPCKIKWILNAGETTCPECGDDYQLSRKRMLNGCILLTCYNSCGQAFRFNQVSQVKIVDGRLVPADSPSKSSVVVPDSLSEPSHFGYPIWQCCRLLEKVEQP